MKSKAKQVKSEGFTPIKLELTFETEEELSQFYTVLNYTPICNYLEDGGINASSIRSKIREASDESYIGGSICDLVKHLK